MTFCRRCGEPTTHVADHIYRCSQHTLFANSQPACAALVWDDQGRLVVGVRAIEPFCGSYDLPGGFVDHQETFEECIVRELREELSVHPADLGELTYVASGLDAYPFAGETLPVLTVTFAVHLRPGARPQAADDLAELAFLPIADIDLEKFCFPSAHAAVRKALGSQPPTESAPAR